MMMQASTRTPPALQPSWVHPTCTLLGGVRVHKASLSTLQTPKPNLMPCNAGGDRKLIDQQKNWHYGPPPHGRTGEN